MFVLPVSIPFPNIEAFDFLLVPNKGFLQNGNLKNCCSETCNPIFKIFAILEIRKVTQNN